MVPSQSLRGSLGRVWVVLWLLSSHRKWACFRCVTRRWSSWSVVWTPTVLLWPPLGPVPRGAAMRFAATTTCVGFVHLSTDLMVSRCGNMSLRKDNVAVAGIVVAKASAADLAENSSFRLCRSCFGRCGPRAVGSNPHEDSNPPDSCVSPSLSSASCSLELSLGSDSGLGEA